MKEATETHNTLSSSRELSRNVSSSGWRVFDAAERYQTPVFGFSDLDLGMNKWASQGFEYPTESMDRGKVVLTSRTNGFYRELWPIP